MAYLLAALQALVGTVMPGSKISVRSTLNPIWRRTSSTQDGVRQAAFGLSKILPSR